jgi:hypothetical protein
LGNLISCLPQKGEKEASSFHTILLSWSRQQKVIYILEEYAVMLAFRSCIPHELVLETLTGERREMPEKTNRQKTKHAQSWGALGWRHTGPLHLQGVYYIQ